MEMQYSDRNETTLMLTSEMFKTTKINKAKSSL